METTHLEPLRCPKCHGKLSLLDSPVNGSPSDEENIVCTGGHVWPVIDRIPSLVHPPISEEDAKWIAQYDAMAPNYDEAIKLYNQLLDTDVAEERRRIAQLIPNDGPVRVLDVSIGTGGNFEALHEINSGNMERFTLHGLDVSTGMLAVAKEKPQKGNYTVHLTHGSVFNLPYEQDQFDVVFHTGGVNTFSDIPKALNEMLRVVVPRGKVIVIDEGLSPEKRETDHGKDILEVNSLFAATPPLDHIPKEAKDLQVSYVMNDTFYMLVFSK